jgi:lipopolysaccharide export system permease protein
MKKLQSARLSKRFPRWQSYFYKEIFKVFFFFLFGFFFLYSLIEYATHMDDFFKTPTLNAGSIALYYLNQFLKRLDFLIPMALLLSTIKVLTTLNVRNEWTVLQVAGLSTRKLLTPFFTVALLCSSFLWANFELFLPSALQSIDEFRITHFHGSHLTKRRELIHLIPLKDNSKLLYQNYIPEKHQLFDVLWIKGQNEIWRMKYLCADPTNPTAYYVDHLVRSETGILEKKESFDTITLSQLKWHPRMARKGLIPFDQKRISELFYLAKSPQSSPYEIPRIKTALAFKVAVPFLAPLVVLALAPVCLVFSRMRSTFFIYAIGLFSLFALYMLLDSLAILGDNGIIAPFFSVLFPLTLIASIIGWRFWVKTS